MSSLKMSITILVFDLTYCVKILKKPYNPPIIMQIVLHTIYEPDYMYEDTSKSFISCF